VKPTATSNEPTITYGNWSACCELKWVDGVLMQKFKQRVKRDWRFGTVGRSMEYEWKPVPTEVK